MKHIDPEQIERNTPLARLEAAILAGDHEGIDLAVRDMHAEAHIIAGSRPSNRASMLAAYKKTDDIQFDYDNEAQWGWAVEYGRAE